jgi:hypothetical protein
VQFLCSGEEARVRFSVAPPPSDSGFAQWRDAMRMVAKLPGGIPPDFRRRVSVFFLIKLN